MTDCDGGALPREARRTDVAWSDLGFVGKKPTAHERAISLVDGDRQKAYGAPEDNLARIGQAWAAVLGLPEPISAFQVALLMSVLKAVRAAHRADEDSVTDLLGYGELAARLRP